MTLYPDQLTAVAVGVAEKHRVAIVSPTGTGKSYIAKAILDGDPKAVFVAPSQEILDGLKQKGVAGRKLWTVKKLHNRLMGGEELDVSRLVIDEAHHAVDDTHQGVFACIPETVPLVGLTATFYRGTPKGTAELHQFWGDPYIALTWTDAAAQGRIRLPHFETVPLVDDDILSVTGGEFSINTVTSEYARKSEDAASILLSHDMLSHPCVVGVSSREMAAEMARTILEVCKKQCAIVDADTKPKDRGLAFHQTLACERVLVHINVVSEGVDLAIRNYLDLSPTLSPRLFVQRAGRIMRPGSVLPKYVCTNRNIERHAYLLEGGIPEANVIQAQSAFVSPSVRNARRAMGLESLGKIKSDSVLTTSGLRVSFYSVVSVDVSSRTSYLCVLHPTQSAPVWLGRTGTDAYSHEPWRVVEAPKSLEGYGSTPSRPLTPGQKKWWDNQARTFGLDPTQDVTARKFQLMPALKDIGYSL